MLKTSLLNAIKDTFPKKDIFLLAPKNPAHGDYALHKSSVPDHKLLTAGFEHELVGSVEQIGNFVNFSLSNTTLWDEIKRILKEKDKYGNSVKTETVKINLEFGDPNTHKLPHIGHLFSYIIGHSWARILEATGHRVFRSIYQGDVGLHVAKCLYIASQDPLKIRELKTLEEKVQFLQECYQKGSQLYEDDAGAKQAIDELNKKIYEHDGEVEDLWKQTRQWSVDYYEKFEEQLGIEYNKHYFESMTADEGKKIVLENVGNVFKESEGAIIFPGEKIGLHNRVFINRFGNPTYEAKDMALAALKYKDWKFDTAIITTASEQNEYFKVIFAALEKTNPELKGKLKHIGFGMVDLKSGKMSSRTGNIISAIDLVEEVEKKAAAISPENPANIGLAAIKYSFLKSEARKNISFNIDESVSLQGNSGPYLLYMYARAKSILTKAGGPGILTQAQDDKRAREDKTSLVKASREELTVVRTLVKFPEVVEAASEKMAPHLIAAYLFDLAQKFNKLYETTPILKAPDADKIRLLTLIKATAQVIQNGLYLLGIETLETI